MQILDGKALSNKVKEEIRLETLERRYFFRKNHYE